MASSQMPLVAPRLAPKSTEILPARLISPVLRKAIVSSETRVLDCSTKVAAVPNSKPLNGVAVLVDSQPSSLLPAKLFRPCSRFCIPNKNKAKPAHSTSQPELYQNDHAKAAKASTIKECFE